MDILWQLLLGDNVNLDCIARLVLMLGRFGRAEMKGALVMSPCKKTTVKKPLKCQRFEEDWFQNRDAFEAFSEYYKDVIIIVEREVDLPSLKSTCIPDMFRDHTWTPLLTGSVEVHHVLVLEFFSNVAVKRDHLNC
nr:hypothetical protein CFP56_40232 [Quercus suber]